jgi:wingless-type MMTV integration site family protein 5
MSEFELLSNVSVSLNLTDKNTDLKQRNKNGLQNLGNFINPITSSNRGDENTFKGINNTTFSIQSDLLDTKDSRKHQVQHLYELQQQQIQELQQRNFSKSATNKILMDIIKPIVTEGHKSPEEETNTHTDHSPIQIIANPNNNQHYEQMNDESRKIIMPLALKTTLIERERPIPTPPPLPKPQSNIEDLKKHLLMLQNYSEVDKSFQSKFVVFKKSTTEAPTTTTTSEAPTTTTTQKATTMPFPMTMGPMYRTKPSINMPLQNSQILRDVSYPYSRVERVTVIPQVFLQNDQQQPDTEDDDKNDRWKEKQEERRKNRKNEKKLKKERKRNNKNKLQNMIPPTSTAAPLRSMRREQRRRNNFDMSQQKPFNGSQVLISTTTAPYIINLNDKGLSNNNNDNARKLSRAIRSKANRRRNQNKMQRDILIPMETVSSGSKNVTNEKIDLNPKHCYEVSGMSKGQQKLCDQFTSIMPAISRGARAAIQVRLLQLFISSICYVHTICFPPRIQKKFLSFQITLILTCRTSTYNSFLFKPDTNLILHEEYE